MKDMGEADVILGIKIKRKNKGIVITQSHYIEKILKKFNHEDCSSVSTPMDPVEKLKPNTVGRLSRFTSNPSRQHWQAITRVFKYLKGTMNYGLSYMGYPSVLEGYSDASWINHVEDSSSTSGWVFLLRGGAISWASKKQTCITGSTMKSEFVALAATGKEAEWLRNLIHEIIIWPKPIAPISIRCDSAPTMTKAYSQIYNGKCKTKRITYVNMKFYRFKKLKLGFLREGIMLHFNGGNNMVWSSNAMVSLRSNNTEEVMAQLLDNGMKLGRDLVTGIERFITSLIILDSSGMGRKEWDVYADVAVDSCGRFGLCCPYGSYSINKHPPCTCIKGFEPKPPKEWDASDCSSGCKRKNPLKCENKDGFQKISRVKVPDTRRSWYNYSMSLRECEMKCQKNCSCTVYTSLDINNGGSGYLLWFDELMDIRVCDSSLHINIPMAASESCFLMSI
ncbi:zinc finger, CCHC-type containing protein [Tanacetum coccineum]|uniref:Zinc finger, CCHC-type containing protein n=1 Tax=Tanacetum coccineum TaxID=301880 RepID=A0ABQ4ZPN2_9ASTR